MTTKQRIYILSLLCHVVLSASMLQGMEEEEISDNKNREQDIEMGLSNPPRWDIVDQNYFSKQKTKEWLKTVAWEAGGLTAVGGGLTLNFMVPEALYGSFALFCLGLAICGGRVPFHKKAFKKIKKSQKLACYTAHIAARNQNGQKLLVLHEAAQGIKKRIEYWSEMRPHSDLKIRLQEYGFGNLLPNPATINSKERTQSLMSLLLSLKRNEYDKGLGKDIRYKIIAHCPELICNQQLFNLALPHIEQETDYANYIIYCPLPWFKNYYHTECPNELQKQFAIRVATAGTSVFLNTIYDLLPQDDRNNPHTFGDVAKVWRHVFNTFRKKITTH